MTNFTPTKKCRVCGSKKLEPILSLGNQCVINFTDVPKKPLRAPLELVLCNEVDGGCGLLQLRHTFNHNLLYKKYWYKSGISTTMIEALKNVVTSAKTIINLFPEDIVIDIGANDGTLLRQYKTPGIITVGFEPSNLWKLGVVGTSKIIHNYFSYMAFKKEFGMKKAKIITSIAMFYDLSNPNKFVGDVKRCLDKNGLWIIQMNYLVSMLKNNTFDNISHEHLEYYSLLSLENLLKRHGMEIIDIEINNVNGGSFRVYVKHTGAKVNTLPGSEKRVLRQKTYERNLGLNKKKVYEEFASRINKIRKDLITFLKLERKRGKKIFIYGASTRGLVVLQFTNINRELIDFATDKNPEKWGKYIVGTGIKILSLEEYRSNKPDYLFVLPYHFLDEIKSQEEQFINNGGKFIIAIPKVKIIEK